MATIFLRMEWLGSREGSVQLSTPIHSLQVCLVLYQDEVGLWSCISRARHCGLIYLPWWLVRFNQAWCLIVQMEVNQCPSKLNICAAVYVHSDWLKLPQIPSPHFLMNLTSCFQPFDLFIADTRLTRRLLQQRCKYATHSTQRQMLFCNFNCCSQTTPPKTVHPPHPKLEHLEQAPTSKRIRSILQA